MMTTSLDREQLLRSRIRAPGSCRDSSAIRDEGGRPCDPSTIRPTPLLEKIRVAGLAGYQAIEPWNDEIDGYLKQGGTISELRKSLGDAGLKVVNALPPLKWWQSVHTLNTSPGPLPLHQDQSDLRRRPRRRA